MSRSIYTDTGQELTRYTSDRSYEFEYAPGKVIAFPWPTAVALAKAILSMENGHD